MDVRLTSDGAQIIGAEGTVWREKLTMEEASYLTISLSRAAETLKDIPGCEVEASLAQRASDIFAALTNDSDACIITVEARE